MKQKKKLSKAEYKRRLAFWKHLGEMCPDYESFKSLVLAILNTQVRDGSLAATTVAEIVEEIKEMEDRVAATP